MGSFGSQSQRLQPMVALPMHRGRYGSGRMTPISWHLAHSRTLRGMASLRAEVFTHTHTAHVDISGSPDPRATAVDL